MDTKRNERIEEAMRQLTSSLHEQLLDSGLMTIEQWNEEIAPRMSALSMAVDDVNITARTYQVSNRTP